MADKSKKTRNSQNGDGDGTNGGAPASPPELIVLTRQESAFRASAGRFEALSGESSKSLEELLGDHGATLRPLFGATEERVIATTSASCVRYCR